MENCKKKYSLLRSFETKDSDFDSFNLTYDDLKEGEFYTMLYRPVVYSPHYVTFKHGYPLCVSHDNILKIDHNYLHINYLNMRDKDRLVMGIIKIISFRLATKQEVEFLEPKKIFLNPI